MNTHLGFLFTLPRGRFLLIFVTALIWGTMLLLLPSNFSRDRPRPPTFVSKVPETLLTHLVHPQTKKFAFLKQPGHIFVFGDSYSADGWDGRSDPLVSYAKRVGSSSNEPVVPRQITTQSSADGPQWVRRLADLGRDTTLVNLAFHGATIDGDIVTYSKEHLDFSQQVNAFLHWFSGPSPQAHSGLHWTGSDSLFVVEFGTHDVMLVFGKAKLDGSARLQMHETIIEHYIANVDHLYQKGGRAFSFSLVGPLHRAPIVAAWGDHFRALLRDDIISFNHILVRAIDAYCGQHPDMFSFVDDTYSLFSRILDWPSEYNIKESKTFCKAYRGRTNVEPDTNAHPSCVGPVSDYFWVDTLHPSFSIHKIWADTMRQTLLRRIGL